MSLDWEGGVIYTASFGIPFPPLTPLNLPRDVRAVAFTDSPVPVEGWKISAERPRLDGRLVAKWYKTQSDYLFPNAEWTLWIDSTISIVDVSALLAGVREFLEEKKKSGRSLLGVLKHPDRENIFAESIHSQEKPKYAHERVLEQAAHYWNTSKFSYNFPLYCGGFVLRPNGLQDADSWVYPYFNRMWFNEIMRWSSQDQISMSYAIKENHITPHVFPWHLYDNPVFKWSGANKP